MGINLFIRNIIWAIVIFVLCSVPGDSLPHTSMIEIPHFDKIIHFGLFFIMGIFLIAELRYQTKLNRISIAIFTFLLIAIYGGAIEILQERYFINRSGDIWDLCADVAGGVCSVFMFPILKKQKDLLLNRKPFCNYSFLKKIL
ncbi:VanZ family protein [Ancylomarina euxinus]|uniref:VanZ family protein n=1 Tax=Ancylomarina euxinus TaxID=2283627 RepID=A0A425Y7Z1_9BACT|nr:VanZ family protein [Ancylomarina euxinus]MCZ4693701.1 VanZ family protein [Ancylomarina euxinus]MUP13928.1 VanZ family protein [Ancylomarina euxinus]RRG24444.1 VanZ family protein [Ancylomarina euxinus]